METTEIHGHGLIPLAGGHPPGTIEEKIFYILPPDRRMSLRPPTMRQKFPGKGWARYQTTGLAS